MKKFISVLMAIIVCQGAGFLGSFFTFPAIEGWYTDLKKPSFTPPNWLFGPAWVVLYTLMGMAAFLVWEKGLEKKEVKVALAIFAFQLVLNVLWSILFFHFQSPFIALVEIIILWFFIFLTILKFWQISSMAGFLLLPYLAWVTFAAVLNFFIFKLN